MIDLGCTREELLSEIEAPTDLLSRPPIDPTSSDLDTADEAHFEIAAHTREEILPLVRSILVRRFDWVSEGRLFHDLLLPLKRGLGNAFKRGNAADASKWIRAHVAVTRVGAFVEVRNEGQGFDVAGVLDRFHRRERYFNHGGAGFETLDRSMARVTYTDGGRALLIGYRCPSRDELGASYADADDERFMRDAMRVGFPMLKNGRGEIESLQIGEPPLPPVRQRLELGYELHYRDLSSGKQVELPLLGRVLEPDAAQTDYAVARTLSRGPFRRVRTVRIPKPISAFKSQPHVVFYRLDRVRLLSQWLADREPSELLEACVRVASGLATWHRCGLKPVRTLDLAGELSGRRHTLDAFLAGADDDNEARTGALCDVLTTRATQLASFEPLPVHGRFSWDCVLHDGSVPVLYEFEHACASHPLLDVGGFLADLRMHEAQVGAPLAMEAERAFLGEYGEAFDPEELGFFIAFAALARIEVSFASGESNELERWIDLAESALANPIL